LKYSRDRFVKRLTALVREALEQRISSQMPQHDLAARFGLIGPAGYGQIIRVTLNRLEDETATET